MAVEVRHWGGAMARPTPGSGPVGHRDVPFSVTVNGPVQAAAALAPYTTGGTFLNFLGDPSRTRTAYTPADYGRLRTLKRTCDPANLLGLNHNIPPARWICRSIERTGGFPAGPVQGNLERAGAIEGAPWRP